MNTITRRNLRPLLPILFFILTLFGSASNAIASPLDYGELLKQLEVSLLKGNKRALRDIGTLLDNEDVKIQNKARRLLSKYTLFTSDEFVIKKPQPKTEFLSFYYDIEQMLTYSPLLEVYYISDPADIKIDYKIRALDDEENIDASILLNKYIKRIETAIEAVSEKEITKGINSIKSLNREEGFNYLIDLWEYGKIQELNIESKNKIYEAIVDALQNFHVMESLSVLANMTENTDLSLKTIQRGLANLTNIFIETNDKTVLIQEYINLVDSLESMENLRIYGYEKMYTSRPNFFIESVDYYGQMLSIADKNFWIEHNAIKDLSESQHPRAMLYLSGYLYKLRNKKGKYYSNLAKKVIRLIRQMTQLSIEVKNKKDVLSYNGYERKDPVARANFMIYWAGHYNDYEWDENRNYFINKHEATEATQNYEKLFRRLNSKNDSVAMNSFIQLTEGEPSEIIALSEKYRQMFRNYNKSLPSFQYYYLEQLSELTNYCKKNKIGYDLPKNIQAKLKQILGSPTPHQRNMLENQLIASLTLEDITGLEYWACIHERDKKISYSIGRILDWFYSKHLNAITTDKKQLRLYLKKADIFSNIGAVGSCNYYINKFDLENKILQEALKDIAQTEADENIMNQLSVILSYEEEGDTEDNTGSLLDDFLANPTDFNQKDIKIMPSPQANEYEKIIAAIQNTDDVSHIKRIFFYLRIHNNINMVPHLFELQDDDRIIVQKRSLNLSVSDNLAPILESIYNFSFPEVGGRKRFDVIPWKEMWAKNPKTYKDWSRAFFALKVKGITEKETIDIEDINQITTSPYYEEKYRIACLEALNKIDSERDVRKLQMSPKLNLQTELHYLKGIPFTYKTLDDIPRLFEIDQPKLMFDFIQSVSDSFNIEDKGSLYNNLFRANWFNNYVESKDLSAEQIEKIKWILFMYLDESEYLSEYEEQNTELNIAQLSHFDKTLEERLLMSPQIGTNEASLIRIQSSILAKVKYKELPKVIENLSILAPSLLEEERFFLVKDFGLPVFDLSSSKKQKDFLKRHQSLSEFELYKYYLEQFGVDFLNEKGALDFEKIYEILEFDLVYPFVSGGGGKRDYYTYGIIKLLELYFDTRLDFHEKLNEAQTFYDFSTRKRAIAWMSYLVKNNHVQLDNLLPPSFNVTRDE